MNKTLKCRVLTLKFVCFEFVSCFEFRISNFASSNLVAAFGPRCVLCDLCGLCCWSLDAIYIKCSPFVQQWAIPRIDFAEPGLARQKCHREAEAMSSSAPGSSTTSKSAEKQDGSFSVFGFRSQQIRRAGCFPRR